MNIALRSYLKREKERVRIKKPKVELPNEDNWFVFDCETTNDEFQNLKFGSYRVYSEGTLVNMGIFFDKGLKKEELKELTRYALRNRLRLMSKEDFLHLFFLFCYEKKYICIGHNLVFDISRIIEAFSYCKGHYKGNYSLVLTNNKFRPRIKTMRVNEGKILLTFGSVYKQKKFKGFFVDTQHLASAILDTKKISLDNLAQKLGVKGKNKVNEHGKINQKYIEYNIQDVKTTIECFKELKKRFDKFELDLPITRATSSATIGKAVLRKMNIQPFSDKNTKIDDKTLGQVMSAFYGGRCEVRVRKEPRKVTVLDFTSMYPTMCILMKLQKFITAETIEEIKCTKETQEYLNKVTLEDLFEQKEWTNLLVLCKVSPSKYLVPIRSNYYKNNYTIGINYLTTNQELYYFLPDLIFSKLITGKAPKIIEAKKFVVTRQQKDLQTINLFGKEINPNKDNFIKKLVEERAKIKKSKPEEAQGLKIIANSTTYGIFVETHPNKEKEKINVYSNTNFKTKGISEHSGEYFNPIIGAGLISGARLLLGMIEAELNKMNEQYCACDTDSMFVPPSTAQHLQNKFKQLTPYDSIELLKKEFEDVWFYGISSKRYCVYRKKENKIKIIDEDKKGYKLHGLGHILNPFGKKEDWHKEIWQDILKLHYGLITKQDILEKYQNYYCVSRLTNTSQEIGKRFKTMNKDKIFEEQIKPFNFLLIGTGTDENVKPISNFTKNFQEIVHKEFIDYSTGEVKKGTDYWKNLAETILDYAEHPESKFKDNNGLLKRRNIRTDYLRFIGKETKNIEQQTLNEQSINQYQAKYQKNNLSLATSKKLGVPKSSYYCKTK